jgi:DNA-directed RNA polymerase subunit M/transcription elongation factor TFIIS
MSDIDPNQEWTRLTEMYRQMADEELLRLAAQQDDLTDIARDVLRSEVQTRGLKVEPAKANITPEPELEEGDEIDISGLAVIQWTTVESLEQAQRTRDIFRNSNIPVYFGKQLVEEPERIKSYDKGVRVVIRECDRQRAELSDAEADPEQYRAELAERDAPPEAACCPSCRSLEIVLLNVKNGADGGQVFRWRCDACGHKWTDDGVAQYKPLPQGKSEENL